MERGAGFIDTSGGVGAEGDGGRAVGDGFDAKAEGVGSAGDEEFLLVGGVGVGEGQGECGGAGQAAEGFAEAIEQAVDGIGLALELFDLGSGADGALDDGEEGAGHHGEDGEGDDDFDEGEG